MKIENYERVCRLISAREWYLHHLEVLPGTTKKPAPPFGFRAVSVMSGNYLSECPIEPVPEDVKAAMTEKIIELLKLGLTSTETQLRTLGVEL